MNTELKALETMLKIDNTNTDSIETAKGLLKAHDGNLQSFILEMDKGYHLNTGGGCDVSCLPMDNGQLFTVTDECACIYTNENDFWACEGDKFIEYFNFN
ncbi:MAG: hypothetical protein NZ824_10645 [Candidatus Thioglobus sp.]|nr:hypothetical protein [Candidatus Thioglobus sp.]